MVNTMLRVNDPKTLPIAAHQRLARLKAGVVIWPDLGGQTRRSRSYGDRQVSVEADVGVLPQNRPRNEQPWPLTDWAGLDL